MQSCIPRITDLSKTSPFEDVVKFWVGDEKNRGWQQRIMDFSPATGKWPPEPLEGQRKETRKPATVMYSAYSASARNRLSIYKFIIDRVLEITHERNRNYLPALLSSARQLDSIRKKDPECHVSKWYNRHPSKGTQPTRGSRKRKHDDEQESDTAKASSDA